MMKKVLSLLICVALTVSLLPQRAQASIMVDVNMVYGEIVWHYSNTSNSVIISPKTSSNNFNTSTEYVDIINNTVPRVYIRDGVTEIPCLFAGNTSLNYVETSSSLETIGEKVFNGCTSLRNIILPTNISVIGADAFKDCTALTNISVLDNCAIDIGIDAFSNTGYYNNSENWENDCLYLGKNLIAVSESATDINIKEGTLSIAGGAFREATNLKNVTIPKSVTIIGDSAFYGCTALKNVTIPDSVISIGDSAFAGCTALNSITVSNSAIDIEADAFYNTPTRFLPRPL